MPDFVTFNPLSCSFLNLGNKCQISCSKTDSTISRFVIGFAIKDIARIYDIALHIIAGLGKSMLCIAMAAYSTLAKLENSTANYQKIRKEVFVHFSLSGFYILDIFISYRNITNNYPQDVTEKIETFFSEYLKEPCATKQPVQKKLKATTELSRNTVDKPQDRSSRICQEQVTTQIQNYAVEEQAKLYAEEYPKYLKKYADRGIAEEHTKNYVENHTKFFQEIYLERKKKQDNAKKAETYARDCIRIISALLPKYAKNNTQEEAEKYAVSFARNYVSQYVNALKENRKNMDLTKAKKEAEQCAQKYAEEQSTVLRNLLISQH